MNSTPWKVTPENWRYSPFKGTYVYVLFYNRAYSGAVNMISIKFLKLLWDIRERSMVETYVRNSQPGNANKSWWDFRNFHFIIFLTGSSNVDRCAYLVILWLVFNIFRPKSTSCNNNYLGFLCQVTKGSFTQRRYWKSRMQMGLWNLTKQVHCH